MKILFYSHEIDYGGTWRSHERIIECLDRNQFEPYVMYWDQCTTHTRLDHVRTLIGADHVIPFTRSVEKTGRSDGYAPIKTDFAKIAKSLECRVFHFARSGYYEWPFTGRTARLQMETNIFGYRDVSNSLDRSVAVTQTMADRRRATDRVIYNPIPDINLNGPNLRQYFGLPEDAIVCGRIGRPAHFHPIALVAFRKALVLHPNLYFVIIAPSNEVRAFGTLDGHIIYVDPTDDDQFIDRFYRTLDIFLHFRMDGESSGCAIAQAMMAAVPTVSHISEQFNGHIEILGEGGKVCSTQDEYFDYLQLLIEDVETRKKVGSIARQIALENYEQRLITKQFEECYVTWAK